MKNLYVCEKCGKVHDDWDSAYKCENSHVEVETMYTFNLDSQDKDMPTQFWKDGEESPSTIILRRPRIDQNGNYVKRKLPNGVEMIEYIPVIYTRSTKTELPNGLKKCDYYEAMLRKMDLDNPAISTEGDE